MPNLNKFVKTKTGRNIMSIILGLGIASLFRKMCDNSDCVKMFAVPFKQIKDKIFKVGDSCSQYTYEVAKCSDGKLIPFE